MRSFRLIALSSGLVLAASIAVAIAGTPFGGDDNGTIPSDAPKGPVTKCESKVAKAAAKVVGSIIKCHAGRTTGKYADDTAENGCESTALTKFGATKTAGCAGCTNLSTIGAALEAAVDINNDRVDCDATGTPFGGDDSGFIPPDAPKGPETKCSNGVGKAVAKFVGGITKCHIGRATGKYADDGAEDSCEFAPMAKFAFTKTLGCPSCIGPLPALATFVEGQADGVLNGLIWCGSPSGAFLQ
jgi:hypothetical protein